ncbi:MAG: citryl-CoA lyase [Rhodospirillales bacterium]|nr:citryl-CoA lyase [Rhodospirillales bacterium]
MTKPTTRIGTPTSDTNRFRMRGKDVLTEILGEKSFSEAYYFIVTGKEPTPGEVKIFDSCLIILMDHGITPNALVARLVEESVPTDIQVPVAAGLLMVGNKYAGTMVGTGEILYRCMNQDGDKRQFLADTVAEYRATKRFVPGFGHPYYNPIDPRAARLFEIAGNNGATGEYIELVTMLGEEIDKAAGRHLTLNVTGALGAVLNEIGFPVEVMRAVSVVGRAAGLVAHIYEEKRNPIVPAVTAFVNSIEYLEPDQE